jgi:hypothetical protein
MESKSFKKYQSVIPSEALMTKNFNVFCRMISERLYDIKMKVNNLIKKERNERMLLKTKSDELTERDKTIIRNYIQKLESEIEKWTNVRDRLYKLAKSENKKMKVFMNR